MRITDLKVALIGPELDPNDHGYNMAVVGPTPIVRVETDEGLYGYGQIETRKDWIKPQVEWYKEFILGADPRNVEQVIRRIRRVGAFKPWGAAVSAIEMACWDIAGKAANAPVYRLLGGKVRDKVVAYDGAVRVPRKGNKPQDLYDYMCELKALPQGFKIIKDAVGFHGGAGRMPGFHYGHIPQNPLWELNSGPLTEWGLDYSVDCVRAMKDALGNEVGLALDCGPGFMPSDALRLAKACEGFNLLWMEDLITGDYTPYVKAKVYRDLTMQTSTPIHTGEEIYLRENFMDLIEMQAVNVVGPDPCDVGGIAEQKWVCEYANLHGIMMASHGVGDGLFGLMALVQMAATMPENHIGFELPSAAADWWYDIVTGLPDPIMADGCVAVGDAPGMGIDFIEKEAQRYLREEDADFFRM